MRRCCVNWVPSAPHRDVVGLWAALDSTQESALLLVLKHTREFIEPLHRCFVARTCVLELHRGPAQRRSTRRINSFTTVLHCTRYDMKNVSLISSNLSPKRECCSKWVNPIITCFGTQV